MVMIFSANMVMVGRLVVDGQLRWWWQRQLTTIATMEESNGGGVSTAAVVGTVTADVSTKHHALFYQRQFPVDC